MTSGFLISIIIQILCIAIGIISYKKNAVSPSGLFVILAVSFLFIWLGISSFLFILFYMFASSSLLTLFKRDKRALELIVAKTGPRDYKQALANLGTAMACGIGYKYISDDIFIAAFTGSVCCANADSWASEIGSLSKAAPVMITNFKAVEKGISGGVTLLGLAGGIAGSLFISLASVITFYISGPVTENLSAVFGISFITGILGCLLDSYIGAFSQALYKNKDHGLFTENPAGNTVLLKGSRWIDNDVVNFLTTLSGAVLAGIAFYLIEN
jgi:uncharacterized protein (TIGR00297 family)